MNMWTYSFIICMEIHYSLLSPFPNIQARDIIILQLIQSLLLPLQNQTPHSPHTGFYFQGMSALLGVKGIILQVETSIKAQWHPQDEDTYEACWLQSWIKRTVTLLLLTLGFDFKLQPKKKGKIVCRLSYRKISKEISR